MWGEAGSVKQEVVSVVQEEIVSTLLLFGVLGETEVGGQLRSQAAVPA